MTIYGPSRERRTPLCSSATAHPWLRSSVVSMFSPVSWDGSSIVKSLGEAGTGSAIDATMCLVVDASLLVLVGGSALDGTCSRRAN